MNSGCKQLYNGTVWLCPPDLYSVCGPMSGYSASNLQPSSVVQLRHPSFDSFIAAVQLCLQLWVRTCRWDIGHYRMQCVVAPYWHVWGSICRTAPDASISIQKRMLHYVFLLVIFGQVAQAFSKSMTQSSFALRPLGTGIRRSHSHPAQICVSLQMPWDIQLESDR